MIVNGKNTCNMGTWPVINPYLLYVLMYILLIKYFLTKLFTCLRLKMFYFGIKGIPGGYSYLSFGEGDEKLIGDDVKSDILKSPTTIYAGEGSEEGFNFVQVSFICLKTMHNDAEFTHGLH